MSRPNPFARSGETPQQTGGRFEAFWAKLLGTKPTRGSGNQWTAPMDVGDGRILWNLKFSSVARLRFGSYSVSDLFREVLNHTKGADVIPGVATHGDDGETFVTLRASDFLRIVQSGNYQYIVPTRGEQKRLRARVPALLREDDEA